MTAKSYTLKPMVLVRLAAEVTALLILFVLPAFLFCLPNHLSMPLKTISLVLSPLALILLAFYGFITLRVKVDDQAITAIALLKKESTDWSKLKKLTFKASWNWRRYVVSFQDGEFAFPIWITNLKELVQLIREHLPAEEKSVRDSAQRFFKRDILAIIGQFVQVVIWLSFIAIFWFFFVTAAGGKGLALQDYLLVLGFSVALTAVILWRSLVLILMPKSIEITESQLIISTCFFKRCFNWADVKGCFPAFILLPEGMMLKAGGASFLLNDELESFDELQDAIHKKVVAKA